MPFAPWVLDTLAAYNTSSIQSTPGPLRWENLTDEATTLIWDDLDNLLAAAHSAGVPWADPLAVWPTHDDASQALITYDLPNGLRLSSGCENIRGYLAPGRNPCWGEAVMWALSSIRDTGTRIARPLYRLSPDSVPAAPHGSAAVTRPSEPDGPLSAIRQALAAFPGALRIVRSTDPDTNITVTHHPDRPYSGEDGSHRDHTAYVAALREAGWAQAFNAGPLVMIPGVPPADTAPGTYTATWAITLDDAPDPIEAAYQARETQHDHELTEAVWTVTDAVGRPHIIVTDDETLGTDPDVDEDDVHGGCIQPHLSPDGYVDCDGRLL